MTETEIKECIDRLKEIIERSGKNLFILGYNQACAEFDERMSKSREIEKEADVQKNNLKESGRIFQEILEAAMKDLKETKKRSKIIKKHSGRIKQ